MSVYLGGIGTKKKKRVGRSKKGREGVYKTEAGERRRRGYLSGRRDWAREKGKNRATGRRPGYFGQARKVAVIVVVPAQGWWWWMLQAVQQLA